MTPFAMTTLTMPVELPTTALRPARAGDAGRRARGWATAVMAVASVLMLFAQLGRYAPWDDEAITTMTARNVWRTGDTSVIVSDHNFMAYRNGLLVYRFKDRFTPPLQFYLLAPALRLLGDGNFAMRLPFALCGLVTVCILLRWMWRALPPVPLLWWAAAFALLTNVELFLFSRTCRYYALAMVLTTAAAYLYCHRTGRTRGVAALSAMLAGLLASQYLDYAAAVGVLVVDYAIWGRRDRRITARQWAVLLLPQLVVGAIVCPIWNPVARQHAVGQDPGVHHWLTDHLHLLWLNAVNMVASDFVCLPLLLAAPLLWFKQPSRWLLRAPMAVAVFIFCISFTVATAAAEAQTAEVRYLAPLVPVCVGVAIVAAWGTMSLKPVLRNVLLALSALTVLVGTSIGSNGPRVLSDPLGFYAELVHPQAEPYTPTIDWVNANVPAGASVYVAPDYMVYPLMLRAPGPAYAWQLPDPPRADFAGVPDVNIRGRIAPDYMIQFGTSDMAKGVPNGMAEMAHRGARYELVATLPYHWQDTYRPERVWRTFRTVPPSPGQEIYIYRRVSAAPTKSR
jgi:4-amino-4-deoxy-L-arabinose transferase-like glycosyltransferase